MRRTTKQLCSLVWRIGSDEPATEVASTLLPRNRSLTPSRRKRSQQRNSVARWAGWTRHTQGRSLPPNRNLSPAGTTPMPFRSRRDNPGPSHPLRLPTAARRCQRLGLETVRAMGSEPARGLGPETGLARAMGSALSQPVLHRHLWSRHHRNRPPTHTQRQIRTAGEPFAVDAGALSAMKRGRA